MKIYQEIKGTGNKQCASMSVDADDCTLHMVNDSMSEKETKALHKAFRKSCRSSTKLLWVIGVCIGVNMIALIGNVIMLFKGG